MSKIGDFQVKGNVVRFFLVNDDCMDYTGDDWDDIPYEHNAGIIYDEYVERVIDLAFPIEYAVLEPANDWTYRGNSPFSKDTFKKGKAPCVIIALADAFVDYSISAVTHNYDYAFHFNDNASVIIDCPIGTIIADTH